MKKDKKPKAVQSGTTTIRLSKEMHSALGRLGAKLMPASTANSLAEACMTAVLQAAIHDDEEPLKALIYAIRSASERLTSEPVDYEQLLAHVSKEKAKTQSDPNHLASSGKGHG